jgi:2-polyprenyl-3-methyl-5-hydroxy-6-metoxy-1,4-benzoquinol methylase
MKARAGYIYPAHILLPAMRTYLQQNQPPGVPPLELTGERTLPDVPEENYWYRRHLAVYRWIAARCAGRRVVDMACGEGYGSAVLAEGGAYVTGVDANPDAHEHAHLRYQRANLSFERALIEEWDRGAPWDAIVFLQTVEHVHDAGALLERFAGLLAPGGAAYISTPNRLTLAPAGAQKSGNPWHVREYTPAEYHELLAPRFSHVQLYGVFHARKLRAHELALRAGWDRVHPALGLTQPFYERFVPAIDERDFMLREGSLDRALDLVAVCRP